MGQMEQPVQRIPITIDKSHLITIGERLYAESIELIRELVNNAYDADATRVDVELQSDSIVVEDDGSGMSLEGLTDYFVIGSERKREQGQSPVFGRDLIGQFGIGKFASLAACERFEIVTQQAQRAYRVVFDKREWARPDSQWALPVEALAADARKASGTRVTLLRLTKKFNPGDVEQKIIEACPLRARDFEVYLNGIRIRPRKYAGHVIPVLDGTPHGMVRGEIVILPATSASAEEMGIEVKVRGATIRRELFGMQAWGSAAARVRGELHADFLPITSDRTSFLKDTPEHRGFLEVVSRVMSKVRNELESMARQKEDQRASKALTEALRRIHKALAANPELSPFGAVPIGDAADQPGQPAELKEKPEPEPEQAATPAEVPAIPEESLQPETPAEPPQSAEAPTPEVPPGKRPSVHRLSSHAVLRRMKFGDLGISCCLDHFGENEEECHTEGTLIYINRDHPLFRQARRKTQTYVWHIARLLSQEIALMKNPAGTREAYQIQSRILKSALADQADS